MDTMEKLQTEQMPIQSDVSEAMPLDKQLDGMSKRTLIKYADDLGYTIDGRLSEKTIIQNILKIVNERKNIAQKTNEESLSMTVSEEDPMIEVRFFNLESSEADVEFAYSGKRGMFGPVNKRGYKKCPKYHLFPGEKAKLAYSVYEHLESLTFVTHKTVFDPQTGMIKGTIPIIKPRFILQPIFSKADIMNINKNR